MDSIRKRIISFLTSNPSMPLDDIINGINEERRECVAPVLLGMIHNGILVRTKKIRKFIAKRQGRHINVTIKRKVYYYSLNHASLGLIK